MASFTADERKRLAGALRQGAELQCPACGGGIDRQELQRPEAVPYVRRRVWLLCTSCRRSGAVDLER